KGDEGGNTFHLDDNRNLHAYWDRILDEAVAPEPGEDSIAYATRIARQIDRVAGTPPAGTDALSWAREGLRLAQTVVYAGVSRGSAPSAAYQAEALRVSEGPISLARSSASVRSDAGPPDCRLTRARRRCSSAATAWVSDSPVSPLARSASAPVSRRSSTPGSSRAWRRSPSGSAL